MMTKIINVFYYTPVNVHLPSCPPKPEAIIDAITKLLKKKFTRKNTVLRFHVLIKNRDKMLRLSEE